MFFLCLYHDTDGRLLIDLSLAWRCFRERIAWASNSRGNLKSSVWHEYLLTNSSQEHFKSMKSFPSPERVVNSSSLDTERLLYHSFQRWPRVGGDHHHTLTLILLTLLHVKRVSLLLCNTCQGDVEWLRPLKRSCSGISCLISSSNKLRKRTCCPRLKSEVWTFVVRGRSYWVALYVLSCHEPTHQPATMCLYSNIKLKGERSTN